MRRAEPDAFIITGLGGQAWGTSNECTPRRCAPGRSQTQTSPGPEEQEDHKPCDDDERVLGQLSLSQAWLPTSDGERRHLGVKVRKRPAPGLGGHPRGPARSPGTPAPPAGAGQLASPSAAQSPGLANCLSRGVLRADKQLDGGIADRHRQRPRTDLINQTKTTPGKHFVCRTTVSRELA